jgi:hypothetical protein
VQVFFDPAVGATCYVRSATEKKIDISLTKRGTFGASNDACIKGPAPRYIGAVEGTTTMLARKMEADEILCKHGQGSQEAALWACNCHP